METDVKGNVRVSGVFARGEYSAMIKSGLDDYYSATCAARYERRAFPFRDGKYKLAHGSVAFAFYPGLNAPLTGSLEPFNSIPSSPVNWDTLWKFVGINSRNNPSDY